MAEGTALPALRRLPQGAEVVRSGVHFRCWAPQRRTVEVLFEDGSVHPLVREGDGYFSAWADGRGAGTLYRLRVDGGQPFPDPASRFQPRGPHGPSEVIDPAAYHWRDRGWTGLARTGQVYYELHAGTFTPEGTWDAARAQLERLAQLGITVIELMPVAAFPGRFGWGYDGVNLFAPHQGYGRPDALRAFVDAAHGLGMGVVLDVVYNHFGPDGNYLARLSPAWCGSERSEWGDTPNFDAPGCEGVREAYTSNAAYWISEFHLDGLRLDATQQVFDRSERHILAAIVAAARAAAGPRRVLIAAENEPQHANLARPPAQGGTGCDLLWNDDFHHSARVALTGSREAYFSDYRGRPQEFVSAARHGFLFQGQRYAWQDQPRGTPARDLAPCSFIHFLENHDQVANGTGGRRLSTVAAPGKLRALTALLLLGPQTPLLFQGQEYGSLAPFLYFADHAEPLASAVRKGRGEFLSQFASQDGAPAPAPEAPETFARSRLDSTERETPRAKAWLALHADLLALRRSDPVLRAAQRSGADGAVLGREAFVLRFDSPEGARLLLVNLGAQLALEVMPEPLLAPPAGMKWKSVWSSEQPEYGGGGVVPHDTGKGWVLQGHAALLLVGAAAGRESTHRGQRPLLHGASDE